MDILVTLPAGDRRERLLPPPVREQLEQLGTVTYNESTEQFTQMELAAELRGVDVCVTGWGTVSLDETVLSEADELDLVAHVGGSVASVGSAALYDRGITICSANEVMATYVAEGILAYLFASLRDIPAVAAEMDRGGWPDVDDRTETLFDRTTGFVGLGDVGRELLDLLDPFDVTVLVSDPYVDASDLSGWPSVELTDLDRVLSEPSIVSIHASLTPETHHLLDADRLAQLSDGAHLINAARGPIVDEAALLAELGDDRIRAVLDVFNEEPLPADHSLRAQDNAILFPHVAGSPSKPLLAETVVSEIERYSRGESLRHSIPRERYKLMTVAEV